MKFIKNLVAVALLFTVVQSNAQKEIAWFDAAIKFQYGSSYALNFNIDRPSPLGYDINLNGAYGIGGKFGVNRGYNGLAVELMYFQGGNQFENTASDLVPEIDWNSFDLYLLFRNAANLGWFEIGPKFAFLQNVSRTGESGQLETFDGFNSNVISGVLGFGVNVLGTDGAFSGQIGIRIEYGLTDIFNVDEIGSGEPFPFDTTINPSGADYQQTVPIFAGLVFELNWGLGFYGVAQCGSRAKFFNVGG